MRQKVRGCKKPRHARETIVLHLIANNVVRGEASVPKKKHREKSIFDRKRKLESFNVAAIFKNGSSRSDTVPERDWLRFRGERL